MPLFVPLEVLGCLPLLGRWNMRQKPTGAFKAVLRAPVWLYRWRLGSLLGERFLLITHFGRKSGRAYRTPVEAVEHARQAGEYIICPTDPGPLTSDAEVRCAQRF